MTTAPIKIMLFDDNSRIRDSLELLFNSNAGFKWEGGYADAVQAMQLLEVHTPDVVLMDIEMPFVGGIEATAAIRKKFPDQVVIMLSIYDDEDKVFNAICSGALGYITKSKSLAHLIDAVKEVHNGGAPMTPAVARKVLQLLRQKNAPGDADMFKLTDREKEVLSYLVNGDTYKMIAVKMKICYDTVHGHIKHIYKKLHVNSESEAVAKVLRERLIPTEKRFNASSN
jgi:DNA-binding NarL/FixJ family response regulator